MKIMPLPTRNGEAIIWISLCFASFHSFGVLTASAFVFLHLCRRIYKTNQPNTQRWRQSQSQGGDGQGLLMSCSLIPLLLIALKKFDESREGLYLALSIISSAVATLVWEPNWKTSVRASFQLGLSSWILSHVLNFETDFSLHIGLQIPELCWIACYLTFWLVIASATESPETLGKCASRGEWLVISNLLSLSCVEVFLLVFAKTMSKDELYAFTGATGLLGCSFSCYFFGKLMRTSVFARIFGIASMTLLFVETCFQLQWSAVNYNTPKCLFWIFEDFFLVSETNSSGSLTPEFLHRMPRCGWFVYWLVALSITIPLAPTNKENQVVSRKWFHLIAVLFAPKLQSLSYAVALCVLMLIETTRCQLPWLNAFYQSYLDTSKEENGEETVVSHMGLIFGCAFPLWLSQWTRQTSSVLPFLGVWILGVGDAMGAVIGKNFGRHRWGNQNRTIEGSLAMFLSMCLVFLYQGNSLFSWLPAVLAATLLEAFTLQIDNIILPLAGSLATLLVN